MGRYRFQVTGCIQEATANPAEQVTGRGLHALRAILPDPIDSQLNKLMPLPCPSGATRYTLASQPFLVSDGPLRRSYESEFPFISGAAEGDVRFCEQCSFRPWLMAN